MSPRSGFIKSMIGWFRATKVNSPSTSPAKADVASVVVSKFRVSTSYNLEELCECVCADEGVIVCLRLHRKNTEHAFGEYVTLTRCVHSCCVCLCVCGNGVILIESIVVGLINLKQSERPAYQSPCQCATQIPNHPEILLYHLSINTYFCFEQTPHRMWSQRRLCRPTTTPRRCRSPPRTTNCTTSAMDRAPV